MARSEHSGARPSPASRPGSQPSAHQNRPASQTSAPPHRRHFGLPCDRPCRPGGPYPLQSTAALGFGSTRVQPAVEYKHQSARRGCGTDRDTACLARAAALQMLTRAGLRSRSLQAWKRGGWERSQGDRVSGRCCTPCGGGSNQEHAATHAHARRTRLLCAAARSRGRRSEYIPVKDLSALYATNFGTPPGQTMAPTATKSSEPQRKSARNVTDEAPKCAPARIQPLARHGAGATSSWVPRAMPLLNGSLQVMGREAARAQSASQIGDAGARQPPHGQHAHDESAEPSRR